jgi:hypothetical protein
VSTYAPKDSLIRSSEYGLFSVLLIGFFVISWISYFEYDRIRITLTEKEFKEKILAVLEEQNFLR